MQPVSLVPRDRVTYHAAGFARLQLSPGAVRGRALMLFAWICALVRFGSGSELRRFGRFELGSQLLGGSKAVRFGFFTF